MLSIIRGLGMPPNKHSPAFSFFKESGKNCICIDKCPACQVLSGIPDKPRYQEFHIIRKRGKESILSTFPSKNFLIINPLSKVFAEMLSSRVNHEFLISRHYFSPYNRLIISSSLITNRLTASFFFKILFLDVACSIALRFCSVSAYAYTRVVPS